jgi:3-dehydroquinate dehydratase type I
MLQNQLSKPAVTDLLSQNYTSNKQSFIICLAFSNLRHAIHHLERISYGGDCWELRCDLLTPSDGPLGKTNLPSPEFVAEQIDILQQHSQLPVLFTIRTVSQGGRFPDHADKEALELMLLAIDKGCEYIDVEIEWPSSLIQVVSNGKKDAKVIGSYHEWNGNVRWTSQTLKEKYELADSFSGKFTSISGRYFLFLFFIA